MKAKKTVKAKKKFNFQIDDDWTPTKIYELDDYLKALILEVRKLKPRQSIALPFVELKRKYKWQSSSTASTSIRNMIKKNVPQSLMAKIGVHEDKDMENKVNFIRIRRKGE